MCSKIKYYHYICIKQKVQQSVIGFNENSNICATFLEAIAYGCSKTNLHRIQNEAEKYWIWSLHPDYAV